MDLDDDHQRGKPMDLDDGPQGRLAKPPAASSSGSPMLAVVALNLLLALVVLVKDLKLASFLGTSSAADAFFLAFFIPDAIGSNILAAALAVACVPAFTQLVGSPRLSKQVASHYAVRVLGWCLPLWAGLWLVQKPLLAIMAGRLGESALGSAISLAPLMLPVVLIYPLTALASGFLQAHRRFALPALGPVIQNGIWLLALLMIGSTGNSPLASTRLLAIALPLSALVAFGWLAIGVLRTAAEEIPAPLTRPMRNFRADTSRRLIPSIVIALCTQMMLFGERYWASARGAGVVSALNYAYRLAQFPLWTFVAAVAMVTLPTFSSAGTTDRKSEHQRLAQGSMGLVLLLAIPAGLVLSLLSTPIVTLLMKHGNFDASSIQITASILSGYALAIAPLAVALMGQRILLARGQLWLPAATYGLASIVSFVADGYLVALLGPQGIGYGAALGAGLNAVLMLWILMAKGVLNARDFQSQGIRLVLSHLPLTLVLVGCLRVWPSVSEMGASAVSVYLAGAGLAGLATWWWGLQYLHVLHPILDGLGINRKFAWKQKKGRVNDGPFQMLDSHSSTQRGTKRRSRDQGAEVAWDKPGHGDNR